ncbi:MAG: hypothetical protein CVU06_09210 [Bacteroidetes bacterium HGW-Bacteroidetes-22]|nr:MAG: hypothetical protein CVU06_09210 [Bacteroidetes bacterium HGW-Bacteroidetes-22]
MYKQLSILACSCLLGYNIMAQNCQPVETTATEIRNNLNYLASDQLMGRNTPSPGLDTAAEYIIARFKTLGIKPAGSSYRHSIGLQRQHLGNDNSMTVTKSGKTTVIPLKSGFIPFLFAADTAVESAIIFAGYGITDTANGYDDYRGLDVNGKIVVVLSDGPKGSGVMPSEKLTAENVKANNAISHGAIGFVMINGPARRLILKPRGYPWPSLSKIMPDDLMPVHTADPGRKLVPAVHAGEPVIEALWGSVDALKSVQEKLDGGALPASLPIVEASARIHTNVQTEQLEADNVAAFLEGSDPLLKDELLVIGAHYDHVGAGKDKKDGSDYIFNGADDNASGTSGVMAIAGLFAQQKAAPKRSVLFILFAGEERGLLGSQAYVRKPFMPIAKTVAMINLDMISRNGDSLFLEGAAACPELANIVESKNKGIGLNLILDKNELTGGSDHASFSDKGVPFLFFISGLHNDYHKVTDNPDKSDALKAAKTAHLGFLTAWQIANESQHYTLNK